MGRAVVALAALLLAGCTASIETRPSTERDTTSLLGALAAEARKDSVQGVRYLGTLDDCRLYVLPSGHIVATAPMRFRYSGAWSSPSCAVAAPSRPDATAGVPVLSDPARSTPVEHRAAGVPK